MDHFALRDGVLHAEDVPLPRIAEEVGTPVYVYSRATLERHAQVFRDGLKDIQKTHIAFAIKANPNLGGAARPRAAGLWRRRRFGRRA